MKTGIPQIIMIILILTNVITNILVYKKKKQTISDLTIRLFVQIVYIALLKSGGFF